MAKAPAPMATANKKAPSKSEVLNNIAETTGLNRKQVQAVLDALSEEIKKSLGKKGTGTFQIPGLVKIEKRFVRKKPNTNVELTRVGRERIRNHWDQLERLKSLGYIQ